MMLRFTAYGEPEQMGSMNSRGYHFRDKVTGRLRLDPRTGDPIIGTAPYSANPKLKGWQQLIANGANHALGELPEAERAVLRGPVFVTAAFYFKRTVDLLREKWLKPGAPTPPHLTTPDLDKLARALLDPMSGVVFGDDKQVVRLVVMKSYVLIHNRQPDPPHVNVWVQPAPQPVASLEELLRDQPLFAEMG